MRIFFSVGEPSGDLHGANLIHQVLSRDESVECVGYGGPRMEQAGLVSHFDLTALAVMMFWQVLGKIPRFYKLYRQADRYFASNQVDAVVLIDCPGFNWWIAKAAKRHGIEVFYYGVPQVWAWAPWRVGKLKRRVDHVICKLPFEKVWFEKRNVKAHFVGHPYFDELTGRQLDEQFLQDFDDDESRLLTLLPGSRDQEVQNNLGWMLDTANQVRSRCDNVSVAVACFNDRHREMATAEIEQRNLPFDVMAERTGELIHLADVCLACSGSVSLELMYHRKPAVIVYRLSPLLWGFKKLFLTCPYVTLVNLLWLKDLDRKKSEIPHPHSRLLPYPEFARVENPADEMAKHLMRWLKHERVYQGCVSQLDQIAEQVQTRGASFKAAEYILDSLTDDKAIHTLSPESNLELHDLRRAA